MKMLRVCIVPVKSHIFGCIPEIGTEKKECSNCQDACLLRNRVFILEEHVIDITAGICNEHKRR